ncbi:uncharacterized protein [Apostichopus japonicus]|uniref:uncharacterized protein n=1 Tax=Stichopus japonicus TaxID=307972 RepID=UPI003AB5FE69
MRNLCFITLQETKLQSPNKEWLNEIPQHCVPDEALRMANYFMFRHDRQFSANGGGLITYISKDWAVSYPKVCCSISIPDIELLAVRARPRYLPSDMSNVTIVNVYTRPSSNFSSADKELKSAITKLQKENPRTHFIIAGDVNRESIACIETMGFKNLVNFATFPSSNSVLDAVYVTGDVYHVKKSHPISTSDHSSVLLIPKYTEKHRAKKQRRSRSQKDLSFDNVRSMQEMLQTTDWNVFREDCDDQDELTDVISSYIGFVSDVCIPMKQITPAEMMKRIPPDNKIKQLEKQKQKAIEDKDNISRNRMQREINKHVNNLRSDTFGGIKGNSRAFWDVVKSIRDPTKDDQPRRVDADFGKELSDYFGRFNDSISKDIPLYLPEKNEGCHELDVNVVRKQFGKVKRGVACGSDKIPWWVFKFFSFELAPIYTSLFQESLQHSQIPNLWKTALTSPVPKVANPKDVNDFRPIDLASIAFNSMQRILLPRLTDSINQFGDKRQFAYRKGVSCVDAVLLLIHEVVSELNCKETTIAKVLFLDFSSAFNTVLPNQLITDLSGFITEPWLLHWLAQFLTGWSRHVKLENGLSDRSEIKVGVPQGGPLSALLFTLYTDEIKSGGHISITKYADDTAILCKISKSSCVNDQLNYQQSVNDVVSKCDRKNLLLNAKKSKEMCFANINIKHQGLLSARSQGVTIHESEVV